MEIGVLLKIFEGTFADHVTNHNKTVILLLQNIPILVANIILFQTKIFMHACTPKWIIICLNRNRNLDDLVNQTLAKFFCKSPKKYCCTMEVDVLIF